MKIAIVGTGISGMTAAYLLQQKHEITVFEKNNYIGGHTNTINVKDSAGNLGIDTGFIVYNERNYPHFTRLLNKLNVATQPSQMSFAVRVNSINLEYGARNIRSLFAQKQNLLRPFFYRIWQDFLKMGKEKQQTMLSLGEFLEQKKYSKVFQDYFVLPMVAAIWSAPVAQIKNFPMQYLFGFLENHGLLKIWGRPQWKTITGGSHQYVKKLTASYSSRIRVNQSVVKINRNANCVELYLDNGNREVFDCVVLATHADEALKLLADPSQNEKKVLAAFRYQPNRVILHTDSRLMPQRKAAWASWNSWVTQNQSEFYLTYWMNLLQNLKASQNYFVSLNCQHLIDPAKIIKIINYEHPVYSFETILAQKELPNIQGVSRTYFCGAYGGYGFHEDGLNAAIDVAKRFGIIFE